MTDEFNKWFDEIENYALRSERLQEMEFSTALRAAFEAGRASALDEIAVQGMDDMGQVLHLEVGHLGNFDIETDIVWFKRKADDGPLEPLDRIEVPAGTAAKHVDAKLIVSIERKKPQ